MRSLARLAGAALVLLVAIDGGVARASEGATLANGWNTFAQELARRNLRLTDDLAESLETLGHRRACGADETVSPPPPLDRELLTLYLEQVCRPSVALSRAANEQAAVDEFFTTLTAHLTHARKGIAADTLIYASAGMLGAHRMSSIPDVSRAKWAGMTMAAYVDRADPTDVLKYANDLADSWANRSAQVADVLESYVRNSRLMTPDQRNTLAGLARQFAEKTP